MNYCVRGNASLCAKGGTTKKKKSISAETKKRWEFIDSHTFGFVEHPNGKIEMTARKKK